jgi:hypothetical protein
MQYEKYSAHSMSHKGAGLSLKSRYFWKFYNTWTLFGTE